MEKNIKININKDDELPMIAAKAFAADAEEITLVVPKLSKIAQSVDNFKFLKKGLSGENKTLTVESVDDRALRLAEEAEISARNPFFSGREFSSHAVLASAGPSAEDDGERAPVGGAVGNDVFAEAERELDKVFQPTRRRRYPVAWPLMTLLLLAVGAWFGLKILPQASIAIVTEKVNWSFKDKVAVEKNAVADASQLKIPGQIFNQTKNIQLSFPASRKSYVKQKAAGTITIYNGYSSQPQSLVATTRFETSDGKIVRIIKTVTVPGAEIVDGKITPSSIDAEVEADQPGESYNIGPVARLTIPGFKKSPKYEGFYGELKGRLAGGFIGETAAPTDAEVSAARDKAAQALRQSLEMALASQIPADFKILKDSFQFKVINEKVDIQTGAKGEFALFTEAELTAIGFREEDLLAIIEENMKRELGDDYHIKSRSLSYKSAGSGLTENRADLAVDFSAVAEKPVNYQNLKNKIVGKSEDELRAAIFAVPGLETVKISLWPFWVSRVPKNLEKIEINVD